MGVYSSHGWASPTGKWGYHRDEVHHSRTPHSLSFEANFFLSYHVGQTEQGNHFGDLHNDFNDAYMEPYTEYLKTVYCKLKTFVSMEIDLG